MGRSKSGVVFTLLLVSTACSDSPEEPLLESPSPGQTIVPIATATRVDLGTLGGISSYAVDVNDLGTVVGWSADSAGVSRAFRWTASTGMTDLGTLPGDAWSRAISITGAGRILGVSGRAGDTTGSPVVWTESGPPMPLAIPLPSGASDVNAWGVVVGTNHARVCTNPLAGACWHGFIWNAVSGYRDIGIPMRNSLSRAQVTGLGINDLGIVVGWTSPHGAFPPTQPYIWNERTGFTLLPNFSDDSDSHGGYAQSVNVGGTAVGGSEDGGALQAAAWPKAGGIVKLSAEDPNPSVAFAINASGVIVGWSSLDCCGFTGNHATLWKLGPGRGTTPAPQPGTADARGTAAARAWSESAQLGPVTCLSNPAAVRSKEQLVDCIVKRAATN